MFATLNGWALAAAVGLNGRTRDAVGETPRAWTNEPLRRRKAIAQGYRITTVANTQAQADAIAAHGLGHSFDFFSPSSRSGLVFDATDPAGDLFVRDDSVVPGHPFRLGSATASAVVNPEFRDNWTVLVYVDATLSTYSHLALRSDDAKFIDGVRNDLASFTSYFSVSAGAVGFTAGALADGITGLVLLPYSAPDDAVEAFFRHVSAARMTVCVPLEGTSGGAFNTVSLVSSSANHDARGLTRGPSGTSRAAEFTGTAVADYGPSSPASDSNAATEATWEWLGFIDSAHATATAGYAFSKTDGSTAAGYLIGHSGVNSGVANWGVLTAYAGGDFPFTLTTDEPVTVDEWHHFVVTWNEERGSFLLYLDGILQTATSEATAPGTALNDDSALDFGIGNDVFDLANPWEGRIQGAKFRKAELTADEVLRAYKAAFVFKQQGERPRPFSPLPLVELGGEIVGEEPVAVEVRDGDQPIAQHTLKDGAAWANNNRNVTLSLRESRPIDGREVISGRVVDHDDIMALDGSDLFTRDGSEATVVGTAEFARGPFGFGRARDFDDDATRYTTLPGAFTDVAGVSRLSVGAWVYRAASGGVDTLIEVSNGTNAKLSVTLSSGIIVTARVASGDTAAAFNSSAFSNLDQWSFVFASVDLSGLIRVGVWTRSTGAEVEDSGALSFSDTVFGDDAAAGTRVGVALSGGNPFNGLIGPLYFWPDRFIDEAECERIGRQGLRGVL